LLLDMKNRFYIVLFIYKSLPYNLLFIELQIENESKCIYYYWTNIAHIKTKQGDLYC
jgi:Na+/melibiose symporter-like transporter